jgi:cytochrome c oxidase subunit 2
MTALRFPIDVTPPAASVAAERVDRLFGALSLMWALTCLTLAALIIGFAVYYRRSHRVDRRAPRANNAWLEAAWIFGPMLLFVGLFVWAARVYTDQQHAPSDAMEVYVVGQQWMWKIQHPEGRREINELHVPLGRPVRLLMTSQDVIHSFFVPAFRMKMDVLPGRYTSAWFQATRPGRYHLFCAEYCGTDHATMGGWVYVMAPTDYQRWLEGDPAAAAATLPASGQALYLRLGCGSCHGADGEGGPRGPDLRGLAGKPVSLASGQVAVADESYLRAAILDPLAAVVAGYPPIMPSFKGQLREEDVQRLISYIKSLPDPGAAAPPSGGTP